MRRQKEVSTSVLGSRARWFESVPQRSNAKNPAPLKIKELWVKERRYIVCLNEEERRKDAHDREAIVGHLKEQLRYGDKSLVGNKEYRRYLKVEGSGHFVIDEKTVIRGLDTLQQVEANFQGRRFLFRSQFTAHASQAVRATGVAIPPTLREIQ
jgi:hypothetical protein